MDSDMAPGKKYYEILKEQNNLLDFLMPQFCDCNIHDRIFAATSGVNRACLTLVFFFVAPYNMSIAIDNGFANVKVNGFD
eukprot:CAMPEP_0183714776 /NCGR_PEP_ID=MMETSP0737-20130205/9222_1 /TAXON_ID=385413 /ORGANISM="Thalassiosira miniscula, Strain CCMP1093" /LENGTH=79 /DNA_ID=CAMNT_0025943779 /DNA_START=18 /DNA_END=254 /DNA_ORIENTATION=-